MFQTLVCCKNKPSLCNSCLSASDQGIKQKHGSVLTRNQQCSASVSYVAIIKTSLCVSLYVCVSAAPAGGPGAGAGEGELSDPHGGGGGREQRRQRHSRLGEQTSGEDTLKRKCLLTLN